MSTEKSFASDNHAGVHPKILEAIVAANDGTAHAYGEDRYTKSAIAKFREIFGASTEVFFVFNGTAANVLSVQALARSHEAVFCTEVAHLNTDECGAPEAITGCKLFALPHQHGKLSAAGLKVADAVITQNRSSMHRVQPKVLTITQSTEFGTVYSVAETKAIADFAHERGMYLHMDGARIANAAAALGVGLKELTADAGVDVLSFGGTKNGLLGVEAVVFFRPELAEGFKHVRKQSMQLASKMRYFSTQFEAIFRDDLWLKNAQHANAMASLLAEGLETIPEITITRPVQANAVFATLPPTLIPKLQEKFFFYVWDPAIHEARLMTAFNTPEEDVHAFVATLSALVRGLA